MKEGGLAPRGRGFFLVALEQVWFNAQNNSAMCNGPFTFIE